MIKRQVKVTYRIQCDKCGVLGPVCPPTDNRALTVDLTPARDAGWHTVLAPLSESSEYWKTQDLCPDCYLRHKTEES